MPNFYTDNQDLQFNLENIDLKEAVDLLEEGYRFAGEFDTAPQNYADACDNYKRILTMAGKLCGDNIEPRSETVDEEGPVFQDGKVTYHPLTVQNLEDIRKADLDGIMLPHRFGGLNFPVTIYTMFMEMISRADGSLQNLVGLQDIAETICEFGSEEQKQKYLPLFAEGKVDGSMDLTEPDFGSDLQSVRLRAWQDENGQWYLNGMKRFITNGCSKVHLVLARSEEGTRDGRGLSMFICEGGPKLVVRRIEHKLGIHGVATCELQFNDVPAQLCGKRRFGLIKYVMSLMNGARLAISSQAVGIAEAAYREARKYAAEREQFRQSIDRFPAVYEMLSNMKIRLAAARAILYETSRTVDLRNSYNAFVERSESVTPEIRAKQKYYNKLAAMLTPMCKAYTTESGNSICYDAIQIHGGTGYMHDFKVQRYYRDVRITNIYEGTTQLQVVAAIGGVIQRDAAQREQELMDLPFEGRLAELRDMVKAMLARQEEAVAFVANKKDQNYHDLVARNLVENENDIFASLLLLQGALKEANRTAIAERFILNAKIESERRVARVLSDDGKLIENNRDIIDY